jgi:hypothetical protein
MTTLYFFDDSGFFTSTGTANKCQITGVDLIPANATTRPPIGAKKGSFDIFDGVKWGVFTPDPPPEPTIEERRAAMVISKVKAMQSLKKAGKLNAVFDLMDTLPRDNDMRIMWDYSENLRRTDATLVKVCKDQLGLDDLGIDNLFM